MTAPPLKGNARVCVTKRRYSDEFAARAAAHHVLTTGYDKELAKLSVYNCPSCRGWHMTKKGSVHSVLAVTPLELVQSRDAQWPDLGFIRRMLVEACDAAVGR